MTEILSHLTDEEIHDELKRRELAKRLAAAPVPLSNPDFKPLIDMFQRHIELKINKQHDKDFDHWVYETAAECIYGPDFWNKYRKL